MRRSVLGLVAVLAAGCASGPVDVQTADAVPLRLDRRDPGRLLQSILGAFVGPDGGDPFASGLVTGSGDGLTLHPQRLPADARAVLRDADGDGTLSWDELAPIADAPYRAARAFPPTLDALRAATGYDPDDPAWFTVDVDGVMTAARRRVSVPEAGLRTAMEAFARDGVLRYPAGTWIVGAHVVDGQTVETTAKHRRPDGFWDFIVYDAEGRLTDATATEPRPLRAPTQCTGCHLGQKRYQPESSFPAEAPDGPFGPLAYHVPEAWRSREATALFDEHARRDDGVLGLYATLYAGRLLAARADGTIAPDDAALLERLGL